MVEAEALKVGRAGGEIRTKYASIGTNMHIRNGRSAPVQRPTQAEAETDTSTRAPLFFWSNLGGHFAQTDACILSSNVKSRHFATTFCGSTPCNPGFEVDDNTRLSDGRLAIYTGQHSPFLSLL